MARLLAGTELTVLETALEESELLATEDGATDDGAAEDTGTDELDEDSNTDEGADEGITEERTEETAVDELETLLAITLLLELDTGRELLLPTIPHGEGCAAQVVREIQLLLFS
jgi:hypothetical protein